MTADDLGAFAVELRRLRDAAALSQEELAERAGLTAKAVGALERGERRRPYPNTIRALAGALGLDDEGLVGLADLARRGGAATDTTIVGARPGGGIIPAPPTPTIGRERECREVVAALITGATRMVTLTGPGGVGKTRLAWDVAATVAREGWVTVPVELAPVRSSDLVLPTVARELGVRAGSDDLLTLVASVIGDAERLVVLDNLEHVLDAAPVIATLLSHCPGLRVLATSRAPLRIRAEQEYPVHALALPSTGSAEDVLAAPAGRLFLDRARLVAPGLVLDSELAEAIAAICRRLDGLPLAIELAAAHVRYVSPARLLDRLDVALDDARVRDLPERQQTMQAAFDWSIDLCTAEERRMLQIASVFAGGFDREAVESVAGAEVAEPRRALDGLVEQSLVVAAVSEPGGDIRYRLLEPVRGYAAVSLSAGELAAVARRHADHFGDVAARAQTGLRGIGQADWLDTLRREHDNVAAALETLLSVGDLGAAATITADVWLYWALRGHAGAGLRLVDRIAGSPPFDQLPAARQAAALVASSGLRLAAGDTATVVEHAAQAATLARRAGEDRLLGQALVMFVSASLFRGDGEEAAGAVDELETLAVRIGDGWLRAHGLAARGQHLIMRGELAQADRVLADAEEVARREAGPFTLALVLNVRATHALLEGDERAVFERLATAASIAADVGTTWTLVYTLPGLAGLAYRGGDLALAATLYSAGVATTERSMSTVSFGPDVEAAATQLEQVRRGLDADSFDRAWADGRELEPRDVVALLGSFSHLDEPS